MGEVSIVDDIKELLIVFFRCDNGIVALYFRDAY